ncbi:hypothetical protein [Paenibacillus sp. DMB20]|uniref:hypothetical protein n=1 Tax=Paenibacillus sp. DMB20 TaxID=1642570 RepID=UPI000A767E8C|nr:hypothetical protein [Paenibacillus sp. DMB20]
MAEVLPGCRKLPNACPALLLAVSVDTMDFWWGCFDERHLPEVFLLVLAVIFKG